MLVKNMLRALERAGYILTENIRGFWYDENRESLPAPIPYLSGWIARRPGATTYIEIGGPQGADAGIPVNGNGRIGSIRCRDDDVHDDIQTDYFAGAWMENIKQAIECDTRTGAWGRGPKLPPCMVEGCSAEQWIGNVCRQHDREARAAREAQPLYGYLHLTA